MDLRRLRRKLEAIEALHEGATTEGERAAAAEARDRVARRLVAAEARWTGCGAAGLQGGPTVADPLLREADALPSVAEFLAILAAWEAEERDAASVLAWASRLCDRLLLPCVDVTDPRAARVEVLLNLAAMKHQPLRRGDLPAIRSFLQSEPGEPAWQDWFSFLAGIDWAARR